MSTIGFSLYLAFVVSWFLHLGTRIPALGAIRIDLLLVVVLTGLAAFKKHDTGLLTGGPAQRWLLALFAYIAIAIPFAEWPGSAARNIPELMKAVVFFYFTVAYIDSLKRLKIFMGVYLAAQLVRVFEPVYLHWTQDYWGSLASMSNWEYMNRLAGAPNDIVNPNGLAFVILCVIPFLHYFSRLNTKAMVVYCATLPVLLYALALTGSRSGLIGLAVIYGWVWLKTSHKVVLGIALVAIAFTGFARLSSDEKDRYLSIFSSETKNAETASGRTQGVIDDFSVAMRRPLFGHGLGTSLEANFHFLGNPQPAHNLYAEVTQELGFLGLAVYLMFLKSIYSNFTGSLKVLRQHPKASPFLQQFSLAMGSWLAMNFIFSFASYGLSGNEWYLFGGLTVVMATLARQSVKEREHVHAHRSHLPNVATAPDAPEAAGA